MVLMSFLRRREMVGGKNSINQDRKVHLWWQYRHVCSFMRTNGAVKETGTAAREKVGETWAADPHQGFLSHCEVALEA